MKSTITLVATGARGALLCALALLASSTLRAQSTPAPTDKKDSGASEVIKLEAASVTGSNIRRMDVEKVLPVTVISRDAMDLRSAITPVELLTALPQVTSVPLNETTQGSAGARGDTAGQSSRDRHEQLARPPQWPAPRGAPDERRVELHLQRQPTADPGHRAGRGAVGQRIVNLRI